MVYEVELMGNYNNIQKYMESKLRDTSKKYTDRFKDAALVVYENLHSMDSQGIKKIKEAYDNDFGSYVMKRNPDFGVEPSSSSLDEIVNEKRKLFLTLDYKDTEIGNVFETLNEKGKRYSDKFSKVHEQLDYLTKNEGLDCERAKAAKDFVDTVYSQYLTSVNRNGKSKRPSESYIDGLRQTKAKIDSLLEDYISDRGKSSKNSDKPSSAYKNSDSVFGDVNVQDDLKLDNLDALVGGDISLYDGTLDNLVIEVNESWGDDVITVYPSDSVSASVYTVDGEKSTESSGKNGGDRNEDYVKNSGDDSAQSPGNPSLVMGINEGDENSESRSKSKDAAADTIDDVVSDASGHNHNGSVKDNNVGGTNLSGGYDKDSAVDVPYRYKDNDENGGASGANSGYNSPRESLYQRCKGLAGKAKGSLKNTAGRMYRNGKGALLGLVGGVALGALVAAGYYSTLDNNHNAVVNDNDKVKYEQKVSDEGKNGKKEPAPRSTGASEAPDTLEKITSITQKGDLEPKHDILMRNFDKIKKGNTAAQGWFAIDGSWSEGSFKPEIDKELTKGFPAEPVLYHSYSDGSPFEKIEEGDTFKKGKIILGYPKNGDFYQMASYVIGPEEKVVEPKEKVAEPEEKVGKYFEEDEKTDEIIREVIQKFNENEERMGVNNVPGEVK